MVREASRPVRKGKWRKCNVYSRVRAVVRCRTASFRATRPQGQVRLRRRCRGRSTSSLLGLLSANSWLQAEHYTRFELLDATSTFVAPAIVVG